MQRVEHGASVRSRADRVGEADILALFRDHPPEAAARAAEHFRRAREAADRQRVLDYATLDAAAELAQTIQSAQGSFADLTANGNLSRAHVSRCVHWLIGSQASEMPQSCPKRAVASYTTVSDASLPFRSWAPCGGAPSPRLAMATQVLAFMSEYDGTQRPDDSGIHN